MFDTETTGGNNDDIRIMEIAVVQVDFDGRVLEQYSTLLNPGRPAEPFSRRAHGIDDWAVLKAPRFEDVAGDLVRLFRGSVPVAHNASYDARMLRLEFERMGWMVPVSSSCTRVIGKALNLTLRGNESLDSLCRRYRIPLIDAHNALADACATAELLICYLHEAHARGLTDLKDLDCDRPAPADSWPRIRPTPHEPIQRLPGTVHRFKPRKLVPPPARSPKPKTRAGSASAGVTTGSGGRRGRPPKPETVQAWADELKRLEKSLANATPALRRLLTPRRDELIQKLEGRRHLIP